MIVLRIILGVLVVGVITDVIKTFVDVIKDKKRWS